MALNNTVSSLTKTADTMGENTAKSSADRVSNPTAVAPLDLTASLDPQKFLQQSQDVSTSLFNQSGIQDSMNRMNKSGSAAQDALDFIAEKYKQEELEKLPLEDMKAEQDRLMSAKYRVLPDMLARTDITDYKMKVNLANQLIGTYDSQINSIAQKSSALEKKAEDQAALKVSEMNAKASVLDKQFERDKAELSSRIDLFRVGQQSTQDILQFAVQMKENNKKRDDESETNPFVGLDFSAAPPASAAPSFTDYVRQKEQEAAVTPGVLAFDSSPEAMSKYREEYDTAYNPNNQSYSPIQGQKGGIPGLTTSSGVTADQLGKDYAYALSQVNTKQEAKMFSDAVTSAMAAKNLDLAQRIIEGQKKPLDDKTLGDFGTAIQLEQDMQALHDIYQKSSGSVGQIKGLIAKNNPFNEEVKILMQRINTSLAGLSLSLYGKSLRGTQGALLDKALGDPEMDLKTAHQILQGTIQTLDGTLRNRVKAWEPYYQTLNLQEMLGQSADPAPRFSQSSAMGEQDNSPEMQHLRSLGLIP